MGLFDSRKEQKSIKLVKKLQEQADLEWEIEVTRRREQELNDEAIAKELQAQLQDESARPTTTSPTSTSATPPTTTTVAVSNSSSAAAASLPPPLPTKPRAYNSSISLVSTAHSNSSTNSIPTSSLLPKPLYGLQSSSSSQPSLPPRHQNVSASPTLPSQKPVKSYLSSLQFSITSPTPAPNSVFYQNTPALTPAKPAVTSQPQTNTPAVRPITPSAHMSMPEPIDTSSSSYTPIASNYNHSTSPISTTMHQRASAPTIPVAAAYPPTYPNYPRQNSTPISLPLASNDIAPNGSYNHTTSPVQQNYNHITTPPPPQQQQQQQSYNNGPSTQKSYNNIPSVQQSYSNAPPTQQSYTPLPPLQSSYHMTSPQNYNGTPSAPPPSYNEQSSYHHHTTPTYGSSLPAQASSVSTSLSPVSQSVQHHSSPTVPTMNSMPSWNNQSSSTLPSVPLNNNQSTSTLTSIPLNNQSSSTVSSMPLNREQQQQTSTTNPYFKKHPPKPIFSNSIMTLKPDEEGENEQVEEEEDEWDTMIPVTKRPPTPPAPAATSDDESEYDYSDMVYDRRQEESDPESDPFADTFAVVKKATEKNHADVATVEILDPTIVKRQLSTKIAVEPVSDSIRVYEEKKGQEVVEIRKYEEKESEEIEPPRFQTPIQHALRPALISMESTPVFQQQPTPAFHQQPTPAPTPVFFSPPLTEKDVNNTVYPTNILRAGAPPMMSANNPYNKKQQAVPASDYGYYEETDNSKGKILPKLPESTAKEDRHITVASVNPEQRVWIRIQPTDTGKMLAERIHIVASYQTRRVTKITTKNGRNIPLDNSPLFDDWNEIINFKEGEAWTVDWVPVESPYVDILTEGKDLMKFLKANFKSSSHKDK